MVQGSKTSMGPITVSLLEWARAEACWILGWEVKIPQLNKGQAEEKGFSHTPALSCALKPRPVPYTSLLLLYQVESPGPETRSHLSQSLNQLLQTPKRVKRGESYEKRRAGGSGGGALRLRGHLQPHFLCTCHPPSVILSHYETALEPGGVLVCPQFLFTHVLPLNIECDCLKSW